MIQGIDEARLNRLKSSVEQFEKIQSDQLKKRIELANTTISVTENFDIQHDIRDFCSERGKGLTTIARSQARHNSHDSQRSTTSSTNKCNLIFHQFLFPLTYLNIHSQIGFYEKEKTTQ